MPYGLGQEGFDQRKIPPSKPNILLKDCGFAVKSFSSLIFFT